MSKTGKVFRLDEPVKVPRFSAGSEVDYHLLSDDREEEGIGIVVEEGNGGKLVLKRKKVKRSWIRTK